MRSFSIFCNYLSPLVKKLYLYLSVFEHARNLLLQSYASSQLQRNGNNDTNYASAIFTSVIEKLDQEEAAHKEQFKKEKLVAIFSPTLGYHLEKVFESIQSGDNPAFGTINFGKLTRALKDFQVALAKRGD